MNNERKTTKLDASTIRAKLHNKLDRTIDHLQEHLELIEEDEELVNHTLLWLSESDVILMAIPSNSYICLAGKDDATSMSVCYDKSNFSFLEAEDIQNAESYMFYILNLINSPN